MFNGIGCGDINAKCLTGFTFAKGFERLCTLCDLGYKKINGSCLMINCTSDKPKLFDGKVCTFQHIECAVGYSATR